MTSTDFVAVTDVVILSRRPELKHFRGIWHLSGNKQLSITQGCEWIPRKKKTLNFTPSEVEKRILFSISKLPWEVVIQLLVTTCCTVTRLNAKQLSRTRKHKANTHEACCYPKKWVHVLAVLWVILSSDLFFLCLADRASHYNLSNWPT